MPLGISRRDLNDADGNPICYCGKPRPPHWSTCGGVVCRTTGQTIREAEAAQGAAPRAEGLDAERLAKAIKAYARQQDHEAGRRKGYSDNYFMPEAEAIAAEYARLSRPSDEPCTRFRHDEHCADRHWGES